MIVRSSEVLSDDAAQVAAFAREVTTQPAIPDLRLGEAVFMDWTDPQYFAARAVSRSGLIHMRHDPADFERRHERGLGEPLKETSSMRLGTGAHCATLTPTDFHRRCPCPEPLRPAGARKGTPARLRFEQVHGAWAAMMNAIPDAIRLKPAEYMRSMNIARAFYDAYDPRILLMASGRAEVSIVWREPTSGILVKVKIDRIVELTADDVFGSELEPGFYEVDIKTSENIEPWAFKKSARRYGLDVQASLYCDALQAAAKRPAKHLWLCIESKEKAHPRTAVYPRTDEAVQRGREAYRELLGELAWRRESGVWLKDWERGPYALDI